MNGFCPLASGSKGNCVYLGTPQTKLLIDAGISGRATKEKLAQLDVDVTDIDGILITHNHTDHIRGLKILAYRLGIPIYANAGTAKGIVETFGGDCPKFKIFTTGETFEIDDCEIHPFTIQHDTADPVAFTISCADKKIGFCTDLGFVSTLVKAKLQGCDCLYVEANHQPSMVHASPRPMIYKQRVLSRSGHLSNEACGELLRAVASPKLQQIYLAHLSEECNHPEMALSVVKEILASEGFHPEISIAHQREISQPFLFESKCLKC